MTAAYTLGRLNYAYVDKLYSAGGMRICNLVIEFMGSKDVNLIASCVLAPNARRMAACWNAFEGYPTEAIEKLPALKQFVREQDQKLATAHALLTEVRDACDFDSVRNELLDRIRSFLPPSNLPKTGE